MADAAMMKIFSVQMAWLGDALEPRADLDEPDAGSWWRDPLAHPALARMDLRQLADLPFPRARRPLRDRDA
jgi:hypothetical protein